jgi:hypothetical protein
MKNTAKQNTAKNGIEFLRDPSLNKSTALPTIRWRAWWRLFEGMSTSRNTEMKR